MMAEIAQFVPFAQATLWLGFAIFVRLSAIMAVLPAFGDQPVPVRVRLALSIMFTLIVAPTVAGQVGSVPANMLSALGQLGAEVIAGLFFGVLLRFFILILQIAGTIAAQSTSLAQIFGGTAGVDPQPAISHTLVVAGTALAALSGLHVQAAAYMIHGYDLVPFGTMLSGQILSQAGTGEVSRAFSLAFRLAAPFLIASLIYNVTLGIINRAMPQLMVSFVGAPAITAGGLLLFLIAAPIMLSAWMLAFSEFMAAPFRTWP
ncbi:flagellar biosynthetic protein FliR [Yoonia sediminilitoris]|uniref:Flagellar biosynthetic protein FliR n=1 Tax=Yoonia sediminilitoris TaxID=1286148 RepID=A0A2T6KN57_9RHOB|nr:flagellar biosynthetic protein FliR [Yoonia sediminilitoris]PUB17621.1 flagellar biosynthetic protein FliR [Yoonia sediminilitoris]RCW97916.1 flagellar biosynthetic protein FliR [Yoonia sediminilitoris]